MKLIYKLCLCLSFFISGVVFSAPESRLLKEWNGFNPESSVVIGHQAWQVIIDKYVIENNRQTFFKYNEVSDGDKKQLANYIKSLTSIDPLALNRREQKAYWINLYNAATVNLVLADYPIKTITKLGGGIFQFGPWDDDIVEVNGKPLTLNNIEHGILRPIYQDARIHYAVNCASLGCPNLGGTAYTATNTDLLLEKAAKDFINHPRGVQVDGELVKLSSIYNWYKVDFMPDVLSHIALYAEAPLAVQLKAIQASPGKPKYVYDYDWSINSPLAKTPE